MRIIAGKFGGRRLVSFKADHIRPTTDRIKGSLFNQLEARGALESAKVLDLYAGTGNLGFEALSREAASVDAVELSRASIEIIEKNRKALELGPEYRLHKADVLKWLARYSGASFDVIFADPPFTEKLAHATLESLAQSQVCGANSLIVMESSAHEFVAETYSGLSLESKKSYGDKKAWVWRREC